MSEDELLEILIDYDVSDIRKDEGMFVIYCEPKELDIVKKALEAHSGIIVESAELDWVAKNPMDLDEAQSTKALELLEVLDDHDDVQNVYTNLA